MRRGVAQNKYQEDREIRRMGEVEENIFPGVKFEDVEVSGRRFRFPVHYYDFPRISGVFPASAVKVWGMLPSTRLMPVQPKPGMAVVSMTAFEYRNVAGLAPYNEFSISVAVLYEKGLPGLYVVHLPVTTEEARVAGVEVYGYPKFIAEITFEESAEARRCRVRADGKDIVTLEVKKIVAEAQSIDYYTYTVKDKQLLRTLLQFKGQWGTSRVPGGASHILGDHPIAKQLGDLGLGATSLESTYSPRQQALLHLPGERLPL
jgi:hypothetical protein